MQLLPGNNLRKSNLKEDFMLINKKVSGVLCVLLGGVLAQAHPTTQTVISRPKTDSTVTRPTTHTLGTRPITAVTVSRPETKTVVSRPVTKGRTTRPETEVEVSRPKTEVTVSRPTTEASAPRPTVLLGSSGAGKEGNQKGQSSSKKAAADSTSVQKKTSMSGFQLPKAKDFAAAQNNLGTANASEQAAKDAAAAAFKIPQAKDPSAADAGQNGSSISNSSLLQKVKQKASNRRK